MKKRDTYHGRFGQDCKHLDNDDEPCWGQVCGSSRGIECEGHWGGGPYMSPEDVERERVEAARKAKEAAVVAAAKAERQAVQREAKRWFRPHIGAAKKLEPDPWWGSMSDHMLKMIFSMIGEGIRCLWGEHKGLQGKLLAAGLPAIAEVARRGLEWPVGAYELVLDPMRRLGVTIPPASHDNYCTAFPSETMKLDLTPLDDDTLMLWYGCASQVADYSMLERGTRQTIMRLYGLADYALKERKLQHMDLFDLED